ncbi:hypothetical protein CO054_02740 [Candidatus Shapirobacteria bacterium CG_4_9_14_0_2_um_filter_39_11]|uniref:Peptidase A2 domain-containing protein n=1 Tax=Candidatus Shapirobacteria bacterium CG_4_9_14_0_2_um_filter_39_11 TaxID=1974478 RepID=A0A2M8ES65_9BACT|nr:MAG: hypothetical protein CO054_02740 [Candidatus Shapirobacteria bacterium CG_4_9_14_0_2_um_filter_39_11]
MKPIELASPIKVWYKPLPKFPKIPWPIVDIRLSYKNKTLPQAVFSLVDSGASSSFLHMEIAEALGFNLKKLGTPKPGGTSVSGFYKSWILPELVNIDIYGYSFSFKFLVIDNPDLIWPCILGENSIFEVAGLDFKKFKSHFEIRFRQDIN